MFLLSCFPYRQPASLSAQDRLERIWTLLYMPDAQRLDMAIKYSAEPYSAKLLEVRVSLRPQEMLV